MWGSPPGRQRGLKVQGIKPREECSRDYGTRQAPALWCQVILYYQAPIGSKTLPAWNRMWEVLEDDRWHPRGEVVAAMLAASDIILATCLCRISDAKRFGGIESVGRGRDALLRRVR